MYILLWLIVIIAIVAFLVYRSKNKGEDGDILSNQKISVEDIEENIRFQKEMIFSLEHFDSPHFIDLQNAFDVMEINYLRLKQRFTHDEQKVLEIVKDWYKYAEALRELKSARVMLDVDWNDNGFDNLQESSKEPSIIKGETEKKFKSLLGEDWQEIPPDYFKRMDTMKKPDKKTEERLGLGNDWKWYYRDSANLFKLEEKRKKEKQEAKKEEEKGSQKSGI